MSPTTVIETKYGNFNLVYHEINGQEGLSITYGDITKGSPLLRIHSSCLFSEAINAIDCDCKLQLDEAMRLIAQEGCGTIIYLYQEGRGVGLANKVRAVEVMRTENCDTAAAFEKLGFELDPRDYSLAIAALNEIGISKNVRLLSNNPRKKAILRKAGYEIESQITLSYAINRTVETYLISKEKRLGHVIDWTKIKAMS